MGLKEDKYNAGYSPTIIPIRNSIENIKIRILATFNEISEFINFSKIPQV